MTHDGFMVLLYMVTWIPSIYPLYVSIYTSTMDPMGMCLWENINGLSIATFEKHQKHLSPRDDVDVGSFWAVQWVNHRIFLPESPHPNNYWLVVDLPL